MANRFRIEFEDGATRTVKANIVDLYVEEIEILDLDEGSDNSGNNNSKGMINGKEYTLQVKKFKDDKEPKNKNIINWSYGYSSDDEGVVVSGIKQKGKKSLLKQMI